MGNTPGKSGSGGRSRRQDRTTAKPDHDPYVPPGGDPFADHPNYRGGGGGASSAAAPSTSRDRPYSGASPRKSAGGSGGGGGGTQQRASRTRTENRDSRNRASAAAAQQGAGYSGGGGGQQRTRTSQSRSRSPTGEVTAAARARQSNKGTGRTSAGQQHTSTAPRSSTQGKSRTAATTGGGAPNNKSSGSPPNRSSSGSQDKMFSRRDKMKKEELSAASAKMFVSAQSVKASDIPQPDSSSGKSFDELYRLKEVLGTGAFSTVREGYHRRHRDRMFAIKCVNRSKLTDEDAAALLDEVAILKELRHTHIIRLYDFFEEPGNYYLIMEKMTGGELFDRIVAKAYYNEKEARDTCRIILEAIGYCHRHKIAHRDLKPENLLLVSDDSDSSVKIADFGFAKKVLSPKSLTTQCGTPGYVAPEILEGTPYDTQADMWSVGVILYILLGGYPPFIENNQRELFRKIRRGDYEFHEEYWGAVSPDAKGLISSLLTVDPSKRLDARQALKAPWMIEDESKLAGHDLGNNLEKLKAFNAKRKFRAAVSTVMAANKLQSLGKDFLKNLD